MGGSETNQSGCVAGQHDTRTAHGPGRDFGIMMNTVVNHRDRGWFREFDRLKSASTAKTDLEREAIRSLSSYSRGEVEGGSRTRTGH